MLRKGNLNPYLLDLDNSSVRKWQAATILNDCMWPLLIRSGFLHLLRKDEFPARIEFGAEGNFRN